MIFLNYVRQAFDRIGEFPGGEKSNINTVMKAFNFAYEEDPQASSGIPWAHIAHANVTALSTAKNTQPVFYANISLGRHDNRWPFLTALSAGFVTPEEMSQLQTLEIVTLYDVEHCSSLVALERVWKDPVGDNFVIENNVYRGGNLITEDRADAVRQAARHMGVTNPTDANMPINYLAVVDGALSGIINNFEDETVAFLEAMAQAKQQIVEASEEPSQTYDADPVELIATLVDCAMSFYTLRGQMRDLNQMGYASDEWQAVIHNIYNSDMLFDITEDLVFCIVDKPTDIVERCHNLVGRVDSVVEAINQLVVRYGAVADAVEAEQAAVEAAGETKH